MHNEPLWDDHAAPPDKNRCAFCGDDTVEWIHTGVRWRLFDDNGKQHVCKPNTEGMVAE